jgi:hypothetical protein
VKLPKAKPSAMMELWSINRWLRWTGVRLAIQVDIEHPRESPAWEPTLVGLVWWGWKDLFPPKAHAHWFDPIFDPNCSNCQAAFPGRTSSLPFDPLAQSEDIRIPVRHGPLELNVVTTPVVATTKRLGVRKGHCGHEPKCCDEGEVDDRDPFGCCNCGTRKAEQEPPLAAFSRDLAALQAALPPIDVQAEARLEKLLVEKRKHFPGDAHQVRERARGAGRAGPADHASLQQASEHCLNPIKGENLTWCRGCTNCGTFTPDKDSW